MDATKRLVEQKRAVRPIKMLMYFSVGTGELLFFKYTRPYSIVFVDLLFLALFKVWL